MFEPSAMQTVVVLSLVCAIGLAAGKIRVMGISLGVAFVFFIGILAGHLGLAVNPQMLDYAQSFGLILFVYCLGLSVGPGFFGSLAHEGLSLNMWGLAVILLGTVMAVALCPLTGISLPDMAGLLCGATTNTPALGAAQQTLAQMSLPQSGAALGCAVAYPLGVVGVILAILVLRKLLVKPADLKPSHDSDENETFIARFNVVNPALRGKSIAEIASMTHFRFIISRIWRNNEVIVPKSVTTLQQNDRLMVVTKKDEVDALEKARAMGIGLLQMEGNIGFYKHAGFDLASKLNIHYHDMPKDEDVPFFLAQELIPGYWGNREGTYCPPKGYFVADEHPEAFEAYEATFPQKEKLRLPGQLGYEE